MRRSAAFVKFTQWEHWPTMVYYLPLIPFFLWRSLKAGHPFYFAVANPGILYAGSGTESKFKTLSLLPRNLIPESFLFKRTDPISSLTKSIRDHELDFPLIVKPDIGFRGYLVKKIHSLEELKKYLQHVQEDVIIQQFIPYENELGIFYHRIPDQNKGKITSVTIKKFMKIKGDGHLNLAQLVQKDNRAYLYTDLFRDIHREQWDQVLNKDEEMILSVIGNHSKGTEFINGNHLINDELEGFIDDACQQIKGWYYGRLDIKYKAYDDLLKGNDFKILEVNGIISEPTHIYDASFENASFYKALQAINKHWKIMGNIAQKIHREQHIPYPSFKAYVKNMLWLRSYTKKLKKLNTTYF